MYEQELWNELVIYFNEFSAAGVLGNLQAESGIRFNALQIDSAAWLNGWRDDTYTSAVNSGIYTENEFVNDASGYGIAQWTYFSRKQALYDLKNALNESIASYAVQKTLLINELLQYSDTLKNTTSVREASDFILEVYENPADQSDAVKQYRYELSESFYNRFTGSIPPNPSKPQKITFWHNPYLLLMCKNRRN